MMLGPPASTDTAIITTNINNNNGDKNDDVFDLSSLNFFTASLPSSSSSSTTRFHLSPPHLETLSTSTTSSTTTDDLVDNCCTDMTTSTSTAIVVNKVHNNNNIGAFHDCSSSVSSQETSNSKSNVNDNTSTGHYMNINKRSVFNQYWKKTGQKPIPIRSMRSTFSSTTSLIHTCDIGSVSTNFLSSYSSPHPPSPSTATTSFPEQDYSQLLCSVSNADLLEDDTVARSDADAVASITMPIGTDKRRRSILPAQKQNHSATTDTDLIRETMTTNTRSWRKSSSLSSLQQQKRSTINDITCTNNIHHNHQHRSLTRLSSSTTPTTSCLRSFQRYSPSKNDTAAATAVITAVMDSSLNLSASASSVLSISSSASTSSSCSSSSSVSSKSNVRFDLEVDVRHFEPPKEKYAQKGWSEQFY
jgi:hypothetical protein